MKNGSWTHCVIAMPVFNDWEAFRMLTLSLDGELYKSGMKGEIVAVDDGSDHPPSFGRDAFEGMKAIERIRVLRLKRNMGHQRAIAVALSYIEEYVKCDAVVVMDSDGEDTPSDAVRMIRFCESGADKKVVFAQRTKRSEGGLFRLFYLLYKFTYKVFIGREISFGNFSVIPFGLLQRVVVVSEIWSNYSSGVLKARIPCAVMPSARGVRLFGKSKMNFVALVTHGLSSISVFAENVCIRLLLGTLGITLFSILVLCAVVIIKFTTSLAIPGWATYTGGLAFVVLLQSISISVSFVFIILNQRSNPGFLPYKDYGAFIMEVQETFPRP